MGLAEVFERVIGGAAGGSVAFTAYDGSRSGPEDAAITLEVRSPLALRYIITSPGDLGLARAYVTGHLEVHGDMYTALKLLTEGQIGDLSWAQRTEVVKAAGGVSAFRRPPLPREEHVRSRLVRRHSRRGDAEAISHHYDVSNRFYRWVLGPSMAYTCACYPKAEASLEEAQYEKFDLVARKLGLEPGMTLLDVGCGWGGMVIHAAREYGVRALGVTLSERQAEWAQDAIHEAGLKDLAEVRYLDYRDVPEQRFDAISSIGLTEHIGLANLPSYVSFLASRLRPEGRLLNHCITRPTTKEKNTAGGFINRYVFPDGELEGVGTIISAIQDNGFEVRHEENLREHYALTLRDWGANLEEHWEEAVREVGIAKARVWRLYMAASRLGFDTRRIELHQVLAVRCEPGGKIGKAAPEFPPGQAGVPLRPWF
ncbi:MAG TPA: class I SAM-dependent methyltransferase [Actinomycetes bacterium]|nr:class I SAM-dependent methyltransferase [Actinomycetes bacterium]